MNFRTFVESKEQDQIKKTLGKLPKAHKELVKNYKIKCPVGKAKMNCKKSAPLRKLK